MEIRVLGCSGGIGGSARTTSFIIDQDILIDAGTGAADLPLKALAAIDHVFLTHSHLDHIATLPLMLDTVGPLRHKPVTVYVQEKTLDILKHHVFNWKVWPDFSVIPNKKNPYMVYEVMDPGAEKLINDRRIRSIPVTHTVPAVGYMVSNGIGSFAFSGDTTVTEAFWDVLNQAENLKYLVMETTFPDEQLELSRLSQHLCPSLLASELTKLQPRPELFITHLMAGQEQQVMDQINAHLKDFQAQALTHEHRFQV